jgi:transposase
MFRQLKSDIDVKPLTAHKTEVAMGCVFLMFVSFILYSRLVRMMKETELSKKYSIPSLLLVMNRLKRVELSDGMVFNTEVT